MQHPPFALQFGALGVGVGQRSIATGPAAAVREFVVVQVGDLDTRVAVVADPRVDEEMLFAQAPQAVQASLTR